MSRFAIAPSDVVITRARARETKYSPDQARDELGRFGEGGGWEVAQNTSGEWEIIGNPTQSIPKELAGSKPVSKPIDTPTPAGQLPGYRPVERNGKPCIPMRDHNILHTRLDGKSEHPNLWDDASRAKSDIMHDLAGRMSSNSQDILNATGMRSISQVSGVYQTGSMAAVNRGEFGDRIAAVMDDPNMRAVVTYNSGDMWQSEVPRVQFVTADQAAGYATPDSSGALVDKTVPADDPKVEEALRQIGISSLVHTWADSSNDEHLGSLALQENAIRAFGLERTRPWSGTKTEKSGYTEGYRAKVEATQTEFLKAQYASTQEYLQRAGVSEVALSRGYKGGPAWKNSANGDWREIQFRPLSSWSAQGQTGVNFAGGNGVVVSANVPRERILSCARTGLGCLRENEFVVLGGKLPVQTFGKNYFYNALEPAPYTSTSVGHP